MSSILNWNVKSRIRFLLWIVDIIMMFLLNTTLQCLQIDVLSITLYHINITLGALNLPKISWNLACCAWDSVIVITEFGFVQFIDFPARGDSIFLMSCWRMIYGQKSGFVLSKPLISNSDLCAIEFSVSLYTNGTQDLQQLSFRYSWHKADYDSMNYYLQRHWLVHLWP
jgi:hypothetical protein